ncbi:MAG: hypothetical protein NTW87_18585 [Planctomycetota bacterium]|nr:hypothetical protein [Planctomycetota bacterium]
MTVALRFLSGADVDRALSMEQAIAAMREAFIQLSTGQAVAPLRAKTEIPSHNGTALYMPAYVPAHEVFGVKVVSLFKDNPAAGLPLIHALVMVFDAHNGRPVAVMDGERLTALRTGAASGLATDLLARRTAEIAAIFGAGTQARTQLRAVCAVRPIKQAYVFDKDRSRAEGFCREMNRTLSIPVVVADSQELLGRADVVCTATTSSTPVFRHGDLKPGAHINAVGAYKPTEREIPGETVRAATVVVDQRDACLAEAGDIAMPLKQGLITAGHIHAEIGEIAAKQKPGRTSDSEITLFKSVGNAVQDLAAASRILANARTMGLGTEVQC